MTTEEDDVGPYPPDEPSYQCGKPRHPVREVLRLLAGGKEPPPYVRGYSLGWLSEDQHVALTEWVLCEGGALWWSTGIGILEACDKIVQEAVDNGNIPAEDSPYRHVGLPDYSPITEYDGVQPEPPPEPECDKPTDPAPPPEPECDKPTDPAPPLEPEEDDEMEIDNE